MGTEDGTNFMVKEKSACVTRPINFCTLLLLETKSVSDENCFN